MRHQPTLIDRIDQSIFNSLYGRSLVYNTCWENPAVDRQALNLGPDDTVLVISSAGSSSVNALGTMSANASGDSSSHAWAAARIGYSSRVLRLPVTTWPIPGCRDRRAGFPAH